jgi:hypothetical protein
MKLNKRSSPPALAKGQVWKMPDSYVQIGRLGKRLGEFRKFQTLSNRRVRSQMVSIHQLQQWLIKNHAELVESKE